jgi:hypothetical protein
MQRYPAMNKPLHADGAFQAGGQRAASAAQSRGGMILPGKSPRRSGTQKEKNIISGIDIPEPQS